MMMMIHRRRSMMIVPSILLLVFCILSSSLTKVVVGSTAASTATRSNNNKSVVSSLSEEDRKWLINQQHLLQLRSVFLTETLANERGLLSRGYGMNTLRSVSTVQSELLKETDWSCALSTEEDPKSCLYSFEAEAGSKVIAPANTDQWIQLSALNKLRRMDATKVEPMWHSKYAILKSWFDEESQYSILQHVGVRGWAVTTLLDHKWLLRCLLFSVISLFVIVFNPVIEFIIGRIVASGLLWNTYQNWGRFFHAALPFKLLMGQMIWKFFAGKLEMLESFIRKQFIELECVLLEQSIPVTVGSTHYYNVVEEEDVDDEHDDSSSSYESAGLQVSDDDDSDISDQYDDDEEEEY